MPEASLMNVRPFMTMSCPLCTAADLLLNGKSDALESFIIVLCRYGVGRDIADVHASGWPLLEVFELCKSSMPSSAVDGAADTEAIFGLTLMAVVVAEPLFKTSFLCKLPVAFLAGPIEALAPRVA